jgi:hypothetical protein
MGAGEHPARVNDYGRPDRLKIVLGSVDSTDPCINWRMPPFYAPAWAKLPRREAFCR